MTNEHFTLTWHRDERLLEAKLTGGLWTVADVTQYSAALDSELAGCSGDQKARLLIDLSEYPVQHADVSEANQQLMRRLRESGRVLAGAVVASKAVATMQHSRNLQEANITPHIFATRDEAWAALLAVDLPGIQHAAK